MNTANDIARAIVSGDFGVDDLNKIGQALLFQRNQLTRRNTGQLVLGTKVRWNSGKLGIIMTGSVTKVGRKFVTVNTARGAWRVPAHMLERA